MERGFLLGKQCTGTEILKIKALQNQLRHSMNRILFLETKLNGHLLSEMQEQMEYLEIEKAFLKACQDLFEKKKQEHKNDFIII